MRTDDIFFIISCIHFSIRKNPKDTVSSQSNRMLFITYNSITNNNTYNVTLVNLKVHSLYIYIERNLDT